jgi:putative sterol carrier protein
MRPRSRGSTADPTEGQESMTTVHDLMDRAAAMIRDDPDKARKFGGVCKFALSGEGGRTFIIDLTDDPRVVDGDGDAQCTISMALPDFINLVEGRADPRGLFFLGRLRIKGDWKLAMKFKKLAEIMGGQK